MKNIFFSLFGKFASDTNYIEKRWNEIELNYTDSKRHYHTLTHLQNLYDELKDISIFEENNVAILFALYYHDVIYKVSKNDNEEKSAEKAVQVMTELKVPNHIIILANEIILATKKHTTNVNDVVNYFLDADLSILGKPWKDYEPYTRHIRNEYTIYPNFLYNKGRKQVLNHFLAMKEIYKTEIFQHKYEEIARENLRRELEMLK